MLKNSFEKLFKLRDSAARRRRRIAPGADDGFDAHEKPFLDHLEDLRHTLIRIGATLAISTILCFAFHTTIFELIQIPAKMPVANISEGVMLWDRLDLITLSPPEFILLMLKLSFFSGVILTFPFTVYFLFQFLLPGLRQAEKRAIIPGALVGFFLFLVGVAFAYFLAAPIALKFFYVFENERISNIDPTRAAMEKPIHTFSLVGVEGIHYEPMETGEADLAPVGESDAEADGSALTPDMRSEIRTMIRDSFATIDGSNFALRYDETRSLLVVVETKGGRSIYRIGDYVSFILRLVLVFGISFQMPVVVSILVKLDLLTARVMRSTRTYAWIIILVAAAILTPPDLATLVLLGAPMVFLYEVCIIIATVMERARERRERAEDKARRSRQEQLYLKSPSELTEEEKAELHRAEIEQYEKEHAHLYEDDHDHHDDHGHGHGEDDSSHGVSGTVGRDSLHGDGHDDLYHGDGVHDESWYEDDPHHGETPHEPVQDWPDPDHPEAADPAGPAKSETDAHPDSDHAEPEDLSPGSDAEEADLSADADTSPFHDDEVCAPSGSVVDLNYASLEEIITLPGIGPKLGQAILDHRPYRSFDELEQVPGMGPAKLNGMIDRLMLG